LAELFDSSIVLRLAAHHSNATPKIADSTDAIKIAIFAESKSAATGKD
jgi:hypothetical protein